MSADAPNGKDLRKRVSRSAQAGFTPDGRDPVDIIREQNSTRIQELVPVRISRMLHSPFSFYRGGAALIAHDLAGEANTGVTVMSCGDAHISNFGLFASPERRQLFDVNDFDEAGNAPWEWDVKRLAASVMIAAREAGYTEDQARSAVVSAAGAYRTTLAGLMEQGAVDRYYLSVDVDRLTAQAADDQPLKDLIEQTAKKARKRTSARMVEKITATSADGEPHIVADPPTLVPAPAKLVEGFEGLYAQYLDSIRADAAQLLGQFRVLDWALRVVGVGSVGTRCFIVLLGRDVPGGGTETLFLQLKEAAQSVLQTYGKLGPSTMPPRAPKTGAQAWRVVAGAADPPGAVRLLPRLHPDDPRQGLLLAAVPRHEGVRRSRAAVPRPVREVRPGLRRGARPRPRAVPGLGHRLGLSGQVDGVRGGRRDVRHRVRRPERKGLRRSAGRRQGGCPALRRGRRLTVLARP